MQFQSQRVALPYIYLAVLLFALQVIFGLVTAVKYVFDTDPLLNILPFNHSRAIHMNLLVFWLLFTFMGGTYFLISDESKTELYSVALAKIQLAILTVGGVAAIVGYVFGISWGMPFLEQPTIIKLGIALAAVIFLFNIFMTMYRAKRWTGIQGVLLAGLALLAVMFLFGIPFMKNLTTQYYYWWWVIHLWVEGSWELIASALMAWALIKLTGVEREVVEKWVYIEVALVLFTGIVGTGHHYYWIGTPKYWLWVGGVFSALEPLPILLMTMDTFRHVRQRKTITSNRLALYWLVGSAFVHFMGAGVWGFAQTLPMVNKWTHGTQITASHGHFAFYGAYAMLAIAVIYALLPIFRGVSDYNQKRGFFAFWTMTSMMIFMVLALAVAGVIQAYLQRILGMDFMVTQSYMRPWFVVFWICGWGFLVGNLVFVYDFFRLGKDTVLISGEIGPKEFEGKLATSRN